MTANEAAAMHRERISYNDIGLTPLLGGVTNRLPCYWQRLRPLYHGVAGLSLHVWVVCFQRYFHIHKGASMVAVTGKKPLTDVLKMAIMENREVLLADGCPSRIG